MRPFAVAAIVCILGGVVLFILFREQAKPPDDSALPIVSDESQIIPDGWRDYSNDRYHFSLLYSDDLEVSEQFYVEGAATITFQNVEEGKGFQIFVIPYAEGQVSAERFQKDVPSGVQKNLTDIEIDGRAAAAFYSEDAALGETFEVWFIANGILYEVTTVKSLEPWLLGIMETWEFLE